MNYGFNQSSPEVLPNDKETNKLELCSDVQKDQKNDVQQNLKRNPEPETPST